MTQTLSPKPSNVQAAAVGASPAAIQQMQELYARQQLVAVRFARPLTNKRPSTVALPFCIPLPFLLRMGAHSSASVCLNPDFPGSQP